MADRLYLLKPDFQDQGHANFCAECAMVEGMLSFYPQIRSRLDVRYIGYRRPRPEMLAELGAEHQSSPCLILADTTHPPTLPVTVHVKTAKGKRFINDPFEICEYLAAAHLVGRPHK